MINKELKIISSRDKEKVEKEYKEFINKPTIKILSIEFSTSYEGMEDWCRYSIAIFFERKL
jgi:hypothetical protein